jgi:hypothetical protein
VSQLDHSIAGLAHGAPLWLVLALAFLLGLRHATDPDHLTAVTTLVAADRRDGPRDASRLGLAWGLGHGLMLFGLGAPTLLLRSYLPDAAQRVAETLVGVVVMLLAARLLKRWREGRFRLRADDPHGNAQGRRIRTPLGAFAIGLLHGFGGSAGAAVLVLATVESPLIAVGALALLAIATALSMTALSTGFGLALVRFPASFAFSGAVAVLGVSSLTFGAWYALAALRLIPWSF